MSMATESSALPAASSAESPSQSALPPWAKHPYKWQWTLIDTKGIREFPGWHPGEPEIWAYTEEMAYVQGEKVDLRVHTNCRTFSVRIERDGHTPKIALQREGLPGTHQKTPDNASVKGCGWKPSVTVSTEGWQSGIYIVYLSARDEAGREASGEHFFIVRERSPGSTANRCLVLCTSTYTAYNDWGGANGYRSIRDGVSTDIAEPMLSTQRPWARGFVVRPKDAPDVVGSENPPPFWKPDYPDVKWGLDHGLSRHYCDAGYATYDSRFVRWADKHGYALEFATQHDLHLRPELFAHYKSLIFVGHDEYWTWEMRDTVDAFIENGGHVAHFAGNFACQIRLEEGGKRHVCYGDESVDPIAKTAQKQRSTTAWQNPLLKRPATGTFGLRCTGYTRYGATTPRSSGGFTVYRPWHWVFEKTDLYYGDVFGAVPFNICGFETDGLDYRIETGLPYPTGRDQPPAGIQILALALTTYGEPDRWKGTVPLNAPLGLAAAPDVEFGIIKLADEPGAETVGPLSCALVVYFERGQGSVFNAGSSTWVRGLEMEDFFTMQITKNVLDHFT